jgi:hypothetical protein
MIGGMGVYTVGVVGRRIGKVNETVENRMV